MRARIPLLASAATLALGLMSGTASADEPDEAEEGVQLSDAPQAAPAIPPGATVVSQTPNVIIVETPPAATPQQVVVYQNPPKAEQPTEHEAWYGEQTLLLDGASTAMFVGAGLAANSRTNLPGMLAVAGTVNFLVGPPIVHFIHGRIGPGFGSFALRVALPLEVAFDGLLIGAAMTPRNGGEDIPAAPVYGALIGLGVGAVGASILDAALLARYKTREVDPEAYDPKEDGSSAAPKKDARASTSPLHVEWAPTAGPVNGGATIGFAGVF